MSNRILKIGQLDSLRAIAALMVICHHFIPDYGLGHFSIGSLGVDIFFVISSFLITTILLEQKKNINKKLLIIKNFIVKRTMRLFPAYYVFISFFLFLMYFLKIYVWDSGNGIFYYTYTQNILFYKEGWKGPQLNHLWTLAVEEQFYLLWPWFLIFLKNKSLIRALIIIILSTLLLKSFPSHQNWDMLLFYHFDSLGSGALIALLLQEKGRSFFLKYNKFKIIVIIIALTIFATDVFYKLPYTLILISILLFSVSLVIGCYYNFTSIAGIILNLSLLRYLGTISYGLYLYHKPIPYLITLIINKMHIHVNNIISFFVSIILSITIAHLSYHILEKPFLKLKEKFDL